jgi:small conductance mechanosensitive channel
MADINGTGGMVEQINLRTIVLRDAEGAVHVFPNGSIEKLSNRTKDYAFAVVDVGVAYNESLEQVIALVREIGLGLAADPAIAPNLLAPVEMMGVNNFEETRLIVRARIKTVPLKQWEVAREYRLRIATTFAARGIVMQARQPPR